MNKHLQDMFRKATQLTRQGQLREATQLIQSALANPTVAVRPSVYRVPRASIGVSGGLAAPVLTEPAECFSEGAFKTGSHTWATIKRDYKLYIPPNHARGKLPLVVMLHGCTQDSNDFAAGTGMNERARQQGFFVLYPEQSSRANPSRCWNWFKHNHQRRGSGEPGFLADMTRTIVKQFNIDTTCTYIAGLSAGGAMAAIVAHAYPDIFAAVGVHSGLAPGAAHNVSQALAAMKSGVTAGSQADRPSSEHSLPVDTIVFHGDQDSTVHPINGEQVISAALSRSTAHTGNHDPSTARTQVENGETEKGRRYTRTIHFDTAGQPCAEHWLVHGAGHAWSGGQSRGSYTDPHGPNATDEMLRFFAQQSNRRTTLTSGDETD